MNSSYSVFCDSRYSQLEIVSVGVKSKNLERHGLHFQNFKYVLETESYNYILSITYNFLLYMTMSNFYH